MPAFSCLRISSRRNFGNKCRVLREMELLKEDTFSGEVFVLLLEGNDGLFCLWAFLKFPVDWQKLLLPFGAPIINPKWVNINVNIGVHIYNIFDYPYLWSWQNHGLNLWERLESKLNKLSCQSALTWMSLSSMREILLHQTSVKTVCGFLWIKMK